MKRIAGVYIAWVIAAVMLISAAVARHPYTFYTLLRWICCAVFVYSAFTAHEKKRVAWTWIFAGLAVLYNSIFRVHLDRSTWATVNWFTVGAIVVAAVFFWPRALRNQSASLSEDKLEILPVSRRTVAREWLIFLATLPLGFATCFFLGFYREEPSDLSRAYDYFWNAHFGLGSVSSLALWLAPYLALTAIRSILWSVNTLWRGRNLKRGVLYSFLALYLIAALWFGAALVENVQREAVNRSAITRHFDPTSATLELTDQEVFGSPLYDKLLRYLGRKHPVTVEIPGRGIVEFPAGMSSDEIVLSLKENLALVMTWPLIKLHSIKRVNRVTAMKKYILI